MEYDRRRRPGEDPVTYGVTTGRIAASTASRWRQRIAAGEVGAEFIDSLASATLSSAPAPSEDQRARARSILAAAKAKLGLPASASNAELRAAIDRPVSARHPVAATHRAAASSAPTARVRPGYELNPLIERLPAAQRVAASASATTVPKLFGDADLPAYCMSGLHPRTLLDVPARARHAVAAAISAEDAQHMIEMLDGPDGDRTADELAAHRGWQQYRARVADWVASSTDFAGQLVAASAGATSCDDILASVSARPTSAVLGACGGWPTVDLPAT